MSPNKVLRGTARKRERKSGSLGLVNMVMYQKHAIIKLLNSKWNGIEEGENKTWEKKMRKQCLFFPHPTA